MARSPPLLSSPMPPQLCELSSPCPWGCSPCNVLSVLLALFPPTLPRPPCPPSLGPQGSAPLRAGHRTLSHPTLLQRGLGLCPLQRRGLGDAAGSWLWAPPPPKPRSCTPTWWSCVSSLPVPTWGAGVGRGYPMVGETTECRGACPALAPLHVLPASSLEQKKNF